MAKDNCKVMDIIENNLLLKVIAIYINVWKSLTNWKVMGTDALSHYSNKVMFIMVGWVIESRQGSRKEHLDVNRSPDHAQ